MSGYTTVPELKAIYDDLNKECFCNSLPQPKFIDFDFSYRKAGGKCHYSFSKPYFGITIQGRLRKATEQVRTIMAHEMVHADLFIRYMNEFRGTNLEAKYGFTLDELTSDSSIAFKLEILRVANILGLPFNKVAYYDSSNLDTSGAITKNNYQQIQHAKSLFSLGGKNG